MRSAALALPRRRTSFAFSLKVWAYCGAGTLSSDFAGSARSTSSHFTQSRTVRKFLSSAMVRRLPHWQRIGLSMGFRLAFRVNDGGACV
jgi:hypothetical protein